MGGENEGSQYDCIIIGAERIYDAFWTQTPVNMARFSGFPIKTPPLEKMYFDFFPANHVTRYLSEYVDQPKEGAHTIRQKIKFNTKVDRVDYSAKTGQWKIHCAERSSILSSPQVLVAAGLTSRPNMPHLPDQDGFRGTIIHHVEFGRSSILKEPNVNHVAVLGGAKSAADVVYAAAKAGKRVTWIIRRTGNGPAHLASAAGIGPYKNSNELLYTRATASLSPSIWDAQHWSSRWWHGTKLGRSITHRLWQTFDTRIRREADYHGRCGAQGSQNGFPNLEPDTPLFWQNDSTGINQRPDFWDTVAAKVHVYRQDVVRLSENGIVLEHDDIEHVDAVVCATGWRPSYETFFDRDLALDLGLSLQSENGKNKSDSTDLTAAAAAADKAAEAEILQLFPHLHHPPLDKTNRPSTTSAPTPFRLYRNMIPTNTAKYPGIVFLGHIAVGNNFRAAEVQALWAVAYLHHHPNERPSPPPHLPSPSPSASPPSPSPSPSPTPSLFPPSQAAMAHDVARTLAWCRNRYPAQGRLGHWLYYDLVPYTDALLGDIGLGPRRRRNDSNWGPGWGWASYWFRPCVADDLDGLLDELKARLVG